MDLPHTLSFAVLYRKRIDSFGQLPKDKRPPRNLWDKPVRLEEYLEKVWDTDSTKDKGSIEYLDFDDEEVE